MPQTVPKKENLITEFAQEFFKGIVRTIENKRFFKPSIELTREVINRLHVLTSREYQSDTSDIEPQRRIISEQFYLYLINISKKPRIMDGEAISVKEMIDFNFDKAIGLAYEAEDRNILDKFTSEFVNWLRKEKEEVDTGWGTIKLVSEDKVTMIRFPSNAEYEDLKAPNKQSRHNFESNESVSAAR
ncbi:MAG TPA: hypothetical protein VN956_20335 [Pyrinomonadaceae bacterium]|nr:hypothetical protein [Pyrinomonadaceae bacterium]